MNPSQLQLTGNFDNQVEQIFQHIRLSKDEVNSLAHLFDDLESILQNLWPGSTVIPFGSIVTGLGIQSSDVDCYAKLPKWLLTPGESYVLKAKRLLMSYPMLFQEVFAITTARVPILKFRHVQTGCYCDLNFSNENGVRNSKLLATLLHKDKRAIRLAILIKYWAKINNLTGTNRMPNYALTLLVIFYLQHNSILPYIADLQNVSEEYIINHWNTGFREDMPYESSNNQNLEQLLEGFFKFYADFDFENNIISPYLGYSLNRQDFAVNLPDELSLYKFNLENNICQAIKLNTKMCIQDPFDHDRNCGVAIYPRLLLKIQSLFRHCASLYNSVSPQEILKAILIEAKPEQIVKPQCRISLIQQYKLLRKKNCNRNYQNLRGKGKNIANNRHRSWCQK